MTLTSRRIYILPTPAGLVYAAMLGVTLIGSMNYNNNLGFFLTFLLASAGIVCIYHAHRTLVGLQLRYVGSEPVFAGDDLQVRFVLANRSGEDRQEITLEWPEGAHDTVTIPAHDSQPVSLSLPTIRRGPVPLPALRLSTRTPLGLTQAWTWIHLDAQPLAYPRPAPRAAAATSREQGRGSTAAKEVGDDDFAGLRPYRQGDPARRLAWKSYARREELLVRDFRSAHDQQPIWIDWAALPRADAETQVARLARLVITAFESDAIWGLKVPGRRIEPGSGRQQLHACLGCLATLALPVTRRP